MERLTEKCWRNLDPWECCGQDKYCQRGCHDEGGCTNGCKVPKMYSKLAKYEDLEEQCIAENQCGIGELIMKWKEFFDDIVALYDYRKAEEQKLLKMLPCRVGDTVYVATKTLNKRRGFYGEKQMIFETEPIPEYVECKVVGISFEKKGNFIKVRYTGAFEEKVFDDETGYDYLIITDSVDKNYAFSSVGKTVFLTESALAEKGEQYEK